MTDLTARGPMGLKKPKAEKPTRNVVRKVSKKRAARHASSAGRVEMEYMGMVKQLPCVICGKAGPSIAHHCFHGRYGGRKASNYEVIPLCPEHHDYPYAEAIHTNKTAWAAKHGPDYSYLPMVKAQIGEEI